MVFQHVPYEPLGTLDPLIRSHKHRIRYVNFGREPYAKPCVESYDALIILGGSMNIGEEQEYPHLDVEKKVIRQAMDLDIPVLGICLGAQLIASACGAKVFPADEKEIGWTKLSPTNAGIEDPVVKHFKSHENIFQWHGFTFELPNEAELLVQGKVVTNQAFKVKNNVYGFQFHLEASLPLIQRWLKLPLHLEELGLENASQRVETVWSDTLEYMENSLSLSQKVFSQFLELVPEVNKTHVFSHRH
jgi:GMP synthase (glutamine-hydrolysing)